MSGWYYAKHGKQFGPVSFEQLQQLAARGEFAAGDLVWTDGMADWQEARSIEGLTARPAAPVSSRGAPRGAQARYSARHADGGTPGIVIAGFVLSFFCSIVGLILCLVGLPEAKRRGAGEGLAIAGIVISIVLMIIGIARLAG